MIRFPCNCGTTIAVREELAGDVTQCSTCGRLVDIPHLDDVDKLERDGSVKMSVDTTPKPKNKLEQVPGQGVVLEYRGKRKQRKSPDRRNTLKQFMAAGAPTDPDVVDAAPGDRGKRKLRKPRYDPETGELITPLDVADRGIDAQSVTPIDDENAPDPSAKQTLRYADRTTTPRISLTTLPLDLFQPKNLFVLLIVFAGHILINVYFALPLAFLLFVSLAGVLLSIGIIGHYGNVIEDTGPEERDEVPTLFRHVSFSEDIWLPFVRVSLALCICFWPIVVMQGIKLSERAAEMAAAARRSAGNFAAAAPETMLTPPVVWAALAISGVMFFALPAALLITCTSGSLANLAPQRIARTMWGGGLGYVWCLMLFAAALGVTIASSGGFRVALLLAFDQIMPLPVPTWAFVIGGFIGTALSVYLLHLACFSLGLVYRKHHADFHWVHQHFVKAERDDAMSKLEKFHKRQQARRRAAARRQLVDPDRRDEAQLAALRK